MVLVLQLEKVSVISDYVILLSEAKHNHSAKGHVMLEIFEPSDLELSPLILPLCVKLAKC